MKYFLCFLFLIIQNNYGQKEVEIDKNFTHKKVKKELDYFIDSLEIETKTSIEVKEFQPYIRNFPGLINTKFWFRVQLKNTSSETKKLVYRINTIAFEGLKIYKKTKQGFQEIYSFEEEMNKNIKIPIRLKGEELQGYYFAVNFTKSIYFPIELFEEEEHKSFLNSKQLVLGLFYGFAIMVLLINLFFYINTKDSFFLYYCSLLVGITLTLAELDGLFFLAFGNTHLIKHAGIFLNFFVAVSLLLFTTKAIRLDVYYPSVKKLGIGLLLLNATCFLTYVFTNDLLWYTLGEGVNTIILFIYWISAFVLFKKEIYARYMALGYTVIFVSNILYVLPSEFGFFSIGFTDNYLKIGSAIEMVVFLYAISYRHKKVELERETLAKKDRVTSALEKIEEEAIDVIFEKFAMKYNFSLREKEIANLILRRYTNGEISQELHIQESTVKYHVSNIFSKVEINKRTELKLVYSDFKSTILSSEKGE